VTGADPSRLTFLTSQSSNQKGQSSLLTGGFKQGKRVVAEFASAIPHDPHGTYRSPFSGQTLVYHRLTLGNQVFAREYKLALPNESRLQEEMTGPSPQIQCGPGECSTLLFINILESPCDRA
jgi:hypothetical protein